MLDREAGEAIAAHALQVVDEVAIVAGHQGEEFQPERAVAAWLHCGRAGEVVAGDGAAAIAALNIELDDLAVAIERHRVGVPLVDDGGKRLVRAGQR